MDINKKMITIDYDEYLDLAEYKKILTGANVGYSLETRGDCLDPMRRYEVNQDIYNTKLFDFLKKSNEVVCIRIWRSNSD